MNNQLPESGTSKSLTSYLKYPGGKRKMVPLLAEYYKPYRDRRLVELFVGSASVALGLQPATAVLNDLNPHTINLHTWVQKGLKITVGMTKDDQVYYQYRDWFNTLIRAGNHATPTAAQLFYYLVKTDFNGLIRFNRAGEFNAPVGRYSAINYVEDFAPWQDAFKTWSFTLGDFGSVETQPDDFIYADPPYDSCKEDESGQLSLLEDGISLVNGNGFTAYSGESFNWLDQVRLAEKLAEHPGPALASNAATPRIIKLYRNLGFAIAEIDAHRAISCTGDRSSAKEILAWKAPR